MLEPKGQDGPCIKPASALDLMLHSRKGPYQALMAREDIRIKRVPTALAYALARELEERIQLDNIYFAKSADPEAPKWQVGKPKLVMTYGTAYHTGDQEDWENDIAKELGAEKIGSHEWVQTGGVVFDFKHHVGSSQIPYGRHTALNRDAVWNLIWADQDYAPRANVLVRSHVHYFAAAMDEIEPHLRLTTPALQAMGTRFGSRRCSGLVSFGFVIFEVERGEVTRFEPVTVKLKSQVASVLSV